MLKLIWINVFLLTSMAGPIIVRNGAGESEFSLLFARSSLEALVSICDDVCTLNAPEKALVRELKRRAQHPPQAVFAAKGASQIFEINQNEVHFETSQLWTDPEKTKALDVPAAALLWLQVLAAQAPQLDIRALLPAFDQTLRQKVIRSPGRLGDEVVLEAWLWKGVEDRIFVRDSQFNSLEITPTLREATSCTQYPSNMQIHSMRWTNLSENQGVSVHINMILSWSCGAHAQRARAKLLMQTSTARPHVLRPETVRVFLEVE